ncbi:unnamed protein product [Ostreobium quekettii]|uniref:Uncharacterized protein n=1 Tax=Ostreobium quekettii TaxID=121088 RepID=A0A8S1IV13_9CHLO|nr:unnamed protein product [Ostreobium quekettii]|eukprot:evm.model.scf_9.2 EVM.evm.TU.scf_9.2   scf_9:25224-25529(-)
MSQGKMNDWRWVPTGMSVLGDVHIVTLCIATQESIDSVKTGLQQSGGACRTDWIASAIEQSLGYSKWLQIASVFMQEIQVYELDVVKPTGEKPFLFSVSPS